MRGSPTILIDGRDPFAVERAEASLSCPALPERRRCRRPDRRPAHPGVDSVRGAAAGTVVAGCCLVHAGVLVAVVGLAAGSLPVAVAMVMVGTAAIALVATRRSPHARDG